MTQIESAFIPYTPPWNPYDIDKYAKAIAYQPITLPGMRTIPATHPRLARIFYRIGNWFTEKAEDWDEHTYFVPQKSTTDWKPSGDYTFKWTNQCAEAVDDD